MLPDLAVGSVRPGELCSRAASIVPQIFDVQGDYWTDYVNT